jgi:hypothetical protein
MPLGKHELTDGVTPPVDVEGQQVMRAGIQLGRWIYQNDLGKQPCRFGSFAEVNYAAVMEETPLFGDADGVYVSSLGSYKSTLTAAAGMPMMFGKLTCVNSVILPISGSQRPFSVGYNFSMTRQF